MSLYAAKDDADIRRGYSIRCSLKPDFYEWWPRFTSSELISRLRAMQFEAATLLTVSNIAKAYAIAPELCGNWWRGYRRLRPSEQLSISTSLLRAVGFPDGCAEAVGAVDRSFFVPDDLKAYAMLNHSLWLSGDTNVTMFGVNALVCRYIEKINPSPVRVIEIGFGTGLQSCIMQNMLVESSFIGFEPNANVLSVYADSPYANERVSVFNTFFELDSFDFLDGDLVVFSCSIDEKTEAVLIRKMSSCTAHAIYATSASEAVFNKYLRGTVVFAGERIRDYDAYRSNPRAYQILKLVRFSNNMPPVLLRQVYNIGYVSFKTSMNFDDDNSNDLINILERI